MTNVAICFDIFGMRRSRDSEMTIPRTGAGDGGGLTVAARISTCLASCRTCSLVGTQDPTRCAALNT